MNHPTRHEESGREHLTAIDRDIATASGSGWAVPLFEGFSDGPFRASYSPT